MADTGNPWFIPFAEPSDLVRDWPALSSAVGTAVAGGFTSVAVAGIGTNAQQATSSTQMLVTSTSFIDITGLSVTITPTSASSKILLIAQIAHGVGRTNDGFEIRLVGGNSAAYGATSGGPVFGGQTLNGSDGDRRQLLSGSVVYLDSPATTSATTYKAQVRKSTGTNASINRNIENTTHAGISSISAIEVKA